METIFFVLGSAIGVVMALGYGYMAWLGRQEKTRYWYFECFTSALGVVVAVIAIASGVLSARHISELEVQLAKAEKDLTTLNPDRRITKPQHDALVTALKSIGPQPITIETPNADRESLQYSSDFVSAFKDAGWNPAVSTSVTFTGKADGVVLMSNADAPEWAGPLQQSLNDCKIDNMGIANDQFKKGEVKLFVGHKPQNEHWMEGNFGGTKIERK